MDNALRIRLCLMMFLNYFVWGSWYVTLNTYLTRTLNFSGEQAGLVFGTVALSCMISPFFVGLVADRFLAAEKTLALCHALGGATLLLAAQVTSFGALYWLMLLHCLFFMPSISMTNTLAMRQMKDTGREFPFVRMFGTFGWIAVGVLLSKLGVEASTTPFLIGAGASFAMCVYALTLPHTPPNASGGPVSVSSILGLDALQMLKDRSFATLAIASFLACIPLTYYFSFTNPYLNEVGVPEAAAKMTIGQGAEVFMMLIMPWVFRRVNVKGILLMGLAAWAIRYALFALGDASANMWMFYLAIGLHGICYDFFFMTGQLYTDQAAPRHLRGAAQGFILFVTYGVGMFVGSWLSGRSLDYFTTLSATGEKIKDWTSFWYSASAGAALILLVVLLFFQSKRKLEVSAS
jgi:nucleoside transporter